MITIRINNQVYNGFLEVNASIDIENLCSEFSFSSSLLNIGFFPIARGDKCDIIVDGVTVLTGYVEKIRIHYSTIGGQYTHTIEVSGKDKTQDIKDSKIDGNVSFKTPISLENIIKNTLSAIGYTDYKIINNAGALSLFKPDEIVAGHIGQEAFEFLDAYCSKRQVLLTTDGLGNLLLTRGEGIPSKGNLVNLIGGTENNILEADVNYDDSKRFHTYVMKSQPNKAALGKTDTVLSASQLASLKGTSIDEGIRSSRLYVINVSNLTNSPDAISRAEWERDIRQARAIKYEATVFGHSIIGSNQIWKPLLLVNVTDDFANIKEKLIVRKVTYSLSNEGGDITKLDLVPEDTFILLAEKQNRAKKKKKGGAFLTEAQIHQALFS